MVLSISLFHEVDETRSPNFSWKRWNNEQEHCRERWVWWLPSSVRASLTSHRTGCSARVVVGLVIRARKHARGRLLLGQHGGRVIACSLVAVSIASTGPRSLTRPARNEKEHGERSTPPLFSFHSNRASLCLHCVQTRDGAGHGGNTVGGVDEQARRARSLFWKSLRLPASEGLTC
jgi:hypothetical protein